MKSHGKVSRLLLPKEIQILLHFFFQVEKQLYHVWPNRGVAELTSNFLDPDQSAIYKLYLLTITSKENSFENQGKYPQA